MFALQGLVEAKLTFFSADDDGKKKKDGALEICVCVRV